MLSKRIDLGSIPFGLYKTKDEMVKGRLVKFNQKDGLLEYATSDDEANAFVTLRIETNAGGDIKDHDKIKKDTRAVAHTLVKDNVWATTEVEGIDALKVGDKLTCGADGKLSKGEGKFVVTDISHFGSTPAVDVMYLG
ncbi:hypothetical protein KQI68_07330 [Peptoniphilus sp. MSJ-1]|uniref:Uncharacterized protein n=1 Tax=Peptoniphilus ovalis TaxID=2841503 RepID=A0ABS6FHK3_9FIRM|nr:hypothetical protein [Peptoniphilus ovalis]MBU5669651.1 hypothetical protein [Peptoniphilus ovalis]